MATHQSNTLSTADKQAIILDSVSTKGTLKTGLKKAGITRQAVHWWIDNNVNGFRSLYADAKEDFVEGLEDKLLWLGEQLEAGQNPAPIIKRLEAENPNKYREYQGSAGEQLASTLLGLATLTRNAITSKVVEGESREVEVEDAGVLKLLLSEGDKQW